VLILLCLSNYVVELLIILLVTEEVFGCHLLGKRQTMALPYANFPCYFGEFAVACSHSLIYLMFIFIIVCVYGVESNYIF